MRLKKRVVGPIWRDQDDQCPSILKKLALIRIADTSRNKDKNNNENDASSLSKSFGKNKIPESRKLCFSGNISLVTPGLFFVTVLKSNFYF